MFELRDKKQFYIRRCCCCLNKNKMTLNEETKKKNLRQEQGKMGNIIYSTGNFLSFIEHLSFHALAICTTSTTTTKKQAWRWRSSSSNSNHFPNFSLMAFYFFFFLACLLVMLCFFLAYCFAKNDDDDSSSSRRRRRNLAIPSNKRLFILIGNFRLYHFSLAAFIISFLCFISSTFFLCLCIFVKDQTMLLKNA